MGQAGGRALFVHGIRRLGDVSVVESGSWLWFFCWPAEMFGAAAVNEGRCGALDRGLGRIRTASCWLRLVVCNSLVREWSRVMVAACVGPLLLVAQVVTDVKWVGAKHASNSESMTDVYEPLRWGGAAGSRRSRSVHWDGSCRTLGWYARVVGCVRICE